MSTPIAPDMTHEEDDVKIIAADTTLLNKFGKENLDRVLSNSAVTKAEQVITQASDEFYTDCVNESVQLQSIVKQLKAPNSNGTQLLQKIISTSFAIKTKSGQAGYDLISALAKSLHILCEEIPEGQITPSIIKIIEWHESSIKQILSAKIKGDGGDVGKAIMSEIDKLASKKNL